MTIELALVGWACAIALIDWRWHRVPNVLLMVVAVPAVLVLAVRGHGLLGASGPDSLLGAAMLLVLGLPGYRFGGFGAGDVKLAVVLGFLLGLVRGVEMLLLAFLLIGGIALALAWRGAPRAGRFAAAPALAGAFVVEALGGPWLGVWR